MPHRFPIQLKRRTALLSGSLQIYNWRRPMVAHHSGIIYMMVAHGRSVLVVRYRLNLASTGVRYARMSPRRFVIGWRHVVVAAHLVLTVGVVGRSVVRGGLRVRRRGVIVVVVWVLVGSRILSKQEIVRT